MSPVNCHDEGCWAAPPLLCPATLLIQSLFRLFKSPNLPDPSTLTCPAQSSGNL